MKKLFIGALVLATALFIHIPNATAQEANSEYKQALQEFMSASGSLESMNQLLPQLINMVKTTGPSLPDSYWKSVEDKMRDMFKNKIIEGYVPIYQKYLTLDELKQITAFYQTPIGKKLAQSSPAIMIEGAQLGQKLGMEMFKEIEEEAKNYKP